MKAVISRTPGELGLEEVQAPRPDTGEVVVHVHAAALNPVDAQTLDGLYHDLGMITRSDGVGLGWDAAAGELPLRIAARFPLDDIVAAMRMARVSGLRGRVVLSLD